MRVALGWLEDRMAACWVGHPDDFADYLSGNDDAIEARRQKARRATVLAGGGEIG